MIRIRPTGASCFVALPIAACILSASAPSIVSAGSREDDLVRQHLASGDQFRDSGLTREAIEQYEAAMKIDPENPAVYERCTTLCWRELTAPPRPLARADIPRDWGPFAPIVVGRLFPAHATARSMVACTWCASCCGASP